MYPHRAKPPRELEVFHGFVAASQLPITPETIRSCPEPEPDILCQIGEAERYFELSEVLWERPEAPGHTLARGFHESSVAAHYKARLADAGQHVEASEVVTVGQFGYPPLLSLKQALERKKGKSYASNGRPVSLLLYYAFQSAYEPFDLLYRCPDVLIKLLSGAAFDSVWLYEHAFSNSISLTVGTPAFATLGAGEPVPLRSFSSPEQVNSVIGRIVLKDNKLVMSFDERFGRVFAEGLKAVTEATIANNPNLKVARSD